MTVLRLILGDQLSHQIASLRDINIDTDIVLMAEVSAEVTYVKHQKRNFAEELHSATLRQNCVFVCSDAAFC